MDVISDKLMQCLFFCHGINHMLSSKEFLKCKVNEAVLSFALTNSILARQVR